MSPSTKTGLFRLCILLSVVWVLIVGAVTFHESQDKRKLCSASDMLVAPACHQFFWKWELPDDTAPATAEKDPEQKDQGIHVHIGKINIDVERAKALEHRLNVEHLVLGLVLPLAAIWGLGFGIAWCADGFRKSK